MSVDLDMLERWASERGYDGVDKLVRIARAAVAWRDARPAQGVHSPHKVWTADEAPIVIALNEAGL